MILNLTKNGTSVPYLTVKNIHDDSLFFVMMNPSGQTATLEDSEEEHDSCVPRCIMARALRKLADLVEEGIEDYEDGNIHY